VNQTLSMMHFLRFWACVSLWVLPAMGLKAVTYVYFQNNTTLDFDVSVVQYGTHIMSVGEWSGYSGVVAAWTPDREVMWTNRDQGVHSGDDFYFDVSLAHANDTVKLRLKLHGNFVGSDLWQSASGPGFSHPWHGDNLFHDQAFMMGGKLFNLKYTAEFTGGDDDVRYAIEEVDPWPVLGGGSNSIDVLAYNAYMLTPPIAYTDQAERGAELAAHLEGYDALLMSELFYNDVRDNIVIPALSQEYPSYTAVVDAAGTPEDGGVMIFSKWPIVASTFIVYDSCSGDDCLAAKGAMYAKINKNGRPYHLFATHTQAWITNVQVRQAQFAQLRDFINALNIPSHEAVLVGGDLNVDRILNNQNEYNDMFTLLDAGVPQYQGNPYTYDPGFNLYASGTDYEFLDYVLNLNDHLRPSIDSLNEVRIFRSQADAMWGNFDLSDHFGVYGHFVYPLNPVSVDRPKLSTTVTALPSCFQANMQFLVNLAEPSKVKLQVWTVDGLLVREMDRGQLGSGNHRIELPDAQNLPSGLYLWTFSGSGVNLAGKLMKR